MSSGEKDFSYKSERKENRVEENDERKSGESSYDEKEPSEDTSSGNKTEHKNDFGQNVTEEKHKESESDPEPEKSAVKPLICEEKSSSLEGKTICEQTESISGTNEDTKTSGQNNTEKQLNGEEEKEDENKNITKKHEITPRETPTHHHHHHHHEEEEEKENSIYMQAGVNITPSIRHADHDHEHHSHHRTNSNVCLSPALSNESIGGIGLEPITKSSKEEKKKKKRSKTCKDMASKSPKPLKEKRSSKERSSSSATPKGDEAAKQPTLAELSQAPCVGGAVSSPEPISSSSSDDDDNEDDSFVMMEETHFVLDQSSGDKQDDSSPTKGSDKRSSSKKKSARKSKHKSKHRTNGSATPTASVVDSPVAATAGATIGSPEALKKWKSCNAIKLKRIPILNQPYRGPIGYSAGGGIDAPVAWKLGKKPHQNKGVHLAQQYRLISSSNVKVPSPNSHKGNNNNNNNNNNNTNNDKKAKKGKAEIFKAPKSLESKKLHFSVGFYSGKGRRRTNEDTHVVIEDLQKGAKHQDRLSFFAVYDGHGGNATSEACKDVVHKAVMAHPSFGGPDTETAIREGFIQADSELNLPEGDKSGSTAVVGFLHGKTLYIADLGDSECVLGMQEVKGKPMESVLLSKKHKPTEPDEKERITKEGGIICFGRIFGTLAVSRGFGDFEFKTKDGMYVSNEPFVQTRNLTRKDKFIIFACDGLWDKVTYDDAVKHVGRLLGKKAPTEIAESLYNLSYERGSLDNITIVLIVLRWG